MSRRPLVRQVLCAAVVSLPAAAQDARLSSVAPPPAFLATDRAAKLASAYPEIDRLMQAFAEREKVPGIAYGVIIDGKLAHIGVSGLREVPTKAAVESSTVFRIASMTKSFTAVSILQLRDAGKLSLDAPAERYVPELKKLRYATSDAPRITVRDLMSHSAGFPEDNPWGDQQLARSDAELSRMIERGIPFSNAPATAYEYSNFGFAILGRIVANVSGMPYARYVRSHVLRPLGMRVTTLESRDVPANGLAHGYRVQDGAWLEEAQLPDGSFGPMGGMLTSVADLSRWVGFMLDAWPARDGADTTVLKRSSRREMQQVIRFSGATAVRDSTGFPFLSGGGYGYGLGARQTCVFHLSIAHSGGLPGFGSQMRWLPEYGVGIVALGNRTYTPWGDVIEASFAALGATGALQPRVPQAAPVLNERRAQVSRLVDHWNDALADSLAAMNLYLDESKPRRHAALDALHTAVGGDCRSVGELLPLNALRGSWRMRCSAGDLRVTITLAPTEPAGVQYLAITPMKQGDTLDAPAVCR
jgi:CubicO group peptidase (beta-lactamase class C family)